jgi:DNA-binding NtrC family response regulator
VKKKILVIEDDEAIRSNILDLIDAEGYEGISAEQGVHGVELALRIHPDIIISDITMPVLDGYGVLREVRSNPELQAIPFIFLTAKADRADIRGGMGLGADDYITKPFTRAELLDAIESRLKRQEVLSQRLSQAAPASSRAPSGAAATAPKAIVRDIVVRTPAMRALYEEASRAARANISVLILGETGVGKEVLAHHVHLQSPRASGPFVPLNCAALSPSLLESELFGHEKGAFTGALQSQPGVFESAHGGSVFLDEIGELAPEIQVKLLRVLEDRRVTRVGSRQGRDIDVRFIAATNTAVESAIAEGKFRQDLYFRINGMTLEIPALRDRQEEIGPLAQQFAEAAAASMGKSKAPTVTDATRDVLLRHDWPGNVRELRNVIDRAVALCDGDALLPESLPRNLLREPEDRSPSSTPMELLKSEMSMLERQRIIDVLEQCGGNQTKAAATLGMSRRTLVSRLDAYNLPRPRKKKG